MYNAQIIRIADPIAVLLVQIKGGRHPGTVLTLATASKIVDVNVNLDHITWSGKDCRFDGILSGNYYLDSYFAMQESKISGQYNENDRSGSIIIN